jgi:hypothetical protein
VLAYNASFTHQPAPLTQSERDAWKSGYRNFADATNKRRGLDAAELQSAADATAQEHLLKVTPAADTDGGRDTASSRGGGDGLTEEFAGAEDADGSSAGAGASGGGDASPGRSSQ